MGLVEYLCYMGVTIPEGEGALLEESVSNKPSIPMNCEFNWFMQQPAHHGQPLDCKCWKSLLSAMKGGLHTAGEV